MLHKWAGFFCEKLVTAKGHGFCASKPDRMKKLAKRNHKKYALNSSPNYAMDLTKLLFQDLIMCSYHDSMVLFSNQKYFNEAS